MSNDSKVPYIFSIITPSYNQGEFIEDTLRSVLEQKGDFYIDYIIMDGGSKDNSVELIQKYQGILETHCDRAQIAGHEFFIPRGNESILKCRGVSYRCVSGKDGGQVRALIKGAEKAFGNVVAWINSDDYYLNADVLNLVKSEFEKANGIGFLTGDCDMVGRDRSYLGAHAVTRLNLDELIYLDYHIAQPSTFLHRELFDVTKLDPAFRCTFDARFFVSVLRERPEHIKLGTSLSAFRMYGENITDNKELKVLAFKEKSRSLRDFGTNARNRMMSYLYQYLDLVLMSKVRSGSRLERLLKKLQARYREFCYRTIIKQSYGDRYLKN